MADKTKLDEVFAIMDSARKAGHREPDVSKYVSRILSKITRRQFRVEYGHIIVVHLWRFPIWDNDIPHATRDELCKLGFDVEITDDPLFGAEFHLTRKQKDESNE